MAEELKTIAEMLQEQEEKKEEVKTEEVVVEEPKPESVEVVQEKDTEVEKEPEVAKEEPEEKEEKVEDEQPKKKYAGKFENPEDLEKAYNDLQSAFTKKSMAVSEKVKETESLIDEREFEQRVNSEIEAKAMDVISKTYATITDPEVQKTAAQYLIGYNSTGDVNYMTAYFNCLDRSVERQLQRQLTQISIDTRQSYDGRRSEIMYEPVKKELQELEQEDPQFLQENQEIIVSAIKNNPKTSVKYIRDLIKEVEQKAVEKYKKSQKNEVKVEKSAVKPVSKAPAPRPEDTQKKPERLMSVKEMLLNE